MDTNLDEAEARLRRALRDLSVPEPSAGFAARVFAEARHAHRVRFLSGVAGAALAASLALGVGLAAWYSGPELAPGATPARGPHQVAIAPNETSPVRLVFRSPRALSGVTIHLQLPPGVELDGRPGLRELSWQTELQSGANVLELPVIVRQGPGGVLIANVSRGQDHRQFTVLVQARPPAVLFLGPPGEVTAAVQGAFLAN